MKPVVREYTNDQKLMQDVKELQQLGVAKEDVYVLSHDDDRTDRLADNTDVNTIGAKETGIKHAVGNMFNKKRRRAPQQNSRNRLFGRGSITI